MTTKINLKMTMLLLQLLVTEAADIAETSVEVQLSFEENDVILAVCQILFFLQIHRLT